MKLMILEALPQGRSYGGGGGCGGGVTPARNFIRSINRQDCYSSRHTKIVLTYKTTTDIIFTCYIRNGNFGYSKFIQQDIVIIIR